jgi:spermidine/putrescine transport system ATP-binding protein
VRPEKIDLRLDAADCGGCRLRGTVTEVVYLGTSTNYNVVTSTGAEVTVFVQNSNNADDLAARGQQVWLSWEPRHSYVIGAK